jgi:hypothetical protein
MSENHCGSCTACCRVFAIPDFNKPAGKWCEHCNVGKGCKIYETRPDICATFECLWLQSQTRENKHEHMRPEMRPDKCKVVFSPTTNDKIMSATTMPGSPMAWRRPDVRRAIDIMVQGGFRVVVGRPESTTKIMVTKKGEQEITLTPPDENGMQWGKD